MILCGRELSATGRSVPLMTTDFQIAIDCADPHALNRFWAEVVGYDIEDHEKQIRELMAAGIAHDDDVVTVDGRLAWRTGAACRDPEGRRPRLLFQHVPETKVVKNRLHLDVFVGEEGRASEIARLEALGARRLWDGQQGPNTWVTMADPEGNEFCVA
jgi:Glyoxalase-like domain